MNPIESMKADCKNCYKCLRVCPVKSIRFNHEQAELLKDECIWCGACVKACPQHAKAVRSEVDKVRDMLEHNHPVAVSLAPSFIGSFGADDPMKVVAAFKRLGFAQVRETAGGAAMVSDELVKIAKTGKMDNIITTCCPSVNELVEKHYPELVDTMAPLVSPMIAHARLIKHESPDTKVVFVGPCIAKMAEAEDVRHEDVDAVLTFEDMEKWFWQEGIDLNALDAAPFDGPDAGLARMYPTCAGVIQNAVARGLTGYDTLHVEGAEECKELFRAIQAGEIHGCLIEMNICQGSCMGGPKAGQEKRNRFTGALAVEQYAKKSAQLLGTIPEQEAISLGKVFVNRRKELAQPDEETIRSILRSIGKESRMDELNCGSCGYSSCRAKAIAVFQGKAELSMCLPHMCQAAQSMSNVVLDSTPNAIVIVDEEMKIKEVNSAAQKMFRVSRQEALERSLYEFMDATDFEYVLQNFDAVTDKKRELDEFGVVVRETLVYLPKQHGVMGILNDVTQDEEQEKALYQLRVDTMDMAQKVIDKQMIAAQEIASLLGETTAETKATLTKLKTMIIHNGESQL